MPKRRVGEPVDQFHERDAAYKRQWRKIRRTRQLDAKGNLQKQFITSVPKRKPLVELANTKLARRSSLLDAEGNVIQQWLIEKPEDQARRLLWEDFAQELVKDVPRLAALQTPLGYLNSDLMACYPIGDHHLGMLSWKHETGASYDLDIGERLLTDTMQQLVAMGPACERAAVVSLGDFMHYDSFQAVTPTNRNLLDSDGRFPKLVSVAFRLLRRAIDTALSKHRAVLVILEPGNHDPSTTIMLQVALAHIYESEPRVTIDTSPRWFHYFDHGACLVGVTHGHGRAAKPQDLPSIMAHDQPELWGRTKYRYWWTGHVHHDSVRDYYGTKVESMRILPPADAYAANEGYRSMRDMKAIYLHRDFGEVGRHTVNPAMLETKS